MVAPGTQKLNAALLELTRRGRVSVVVFNTCSGRCVMSHGVNWQSGVLLCTVSCGVAVVCAVLDIRSAVVRLHCQAVTFQSLCVQARSWVSQVSRNSQVCLVWDCLRDDVEQCLHEHTVKRVVSLPHCGCRAVGIAEVF